MVHRSQVLQAHGAWEEAVEEAERACSRLAEPPHPALGIARYQAGELHRLRGEFDLADAAYREAHHHGRDPVPGLALLRLAEGRVAAAAGAIRQALTETSGVARPAVLAAAVEIRVAAGDLPAARSAADELSALASGLGAPVLVATAHRAAGEVALAEGDPAAASVVLRRAAAAFRSQGMPYEEARACALAARARRTAGDPESSALDLDRARRTFARLGARPDLDGLAVPEPHRDVAGPLTGRECDVLRLVAQGHTNKEIGSALSISEHTVARHLQNIFTKLGLSSRAAATAYAYEMGIVATGGPN
jgi:ATP/maltotriose-dependent transcriptional regulator MalT